MAVRKSFGQSPRRKVFVRIQEVNGAQVLSTESFSVWGHSAEQVAHTVVTALEKKFGGEEEEEQEEEQEETARPTIKKKVARGR